MSLPIFFTIPFNMSTSLCQNKISAGRATCIRTSKLKLHGL